MSFLLGLPIFRGYVKIFRGVIHGNQWKMAGNLKGANHYWQLWWPRCNSICEAVALPLKNTLGQRSTHVTWRTALWCSIFVDAGSLLRQPPQVFFFRKKKNKKRWLKKKHEYIKPQVYIYIDQRVNKNIDYFYNRRKITHLETHQVLKWRV